MTTTLSAPTHHHRSARTGWRLPTTAAFYLQASIVVFLLAGSSAPTPLYAVYQAEWHFSPITITIVFGIYALAVLAALLVFGSLSDHVGRRPVLITALIVQAATMLVFATADGVPALIVARIMQGLSTGAAIGALGAGLLDLSRTRGTVANSVAPVIGTASGSLLSGLLVQYLPDRTHLVYLVLFGGFLLQGLGVVLMRESSSPAPGALASLKVRFALPAATRRPLLLAAPVLVAAWSLAGFYGSLGPSIVRVVTGSDSVVLAGLALFTLAGSGAVAVALTLGAAPRTVMRLGTGGLFLGVGLTLVGIAQTSAALFFGGAVIAGIGFGAGFQGAIRSVVPTALPHQRSGVLSLVYVISYLAMGLPAVLAGFLVVHSGGLLVTAREYGIAVMVLSGLAALGLARSTTPAAAPVHEVYRTPELVSEGC